MLSTWILSFNAQKKNTGWGFTSQRFFFDQWGSQCPGRLRNYPEVTQQRRGTICTQAVDLRTHTWTTLFHCPDYILISWHWFIFLIDAVSLCLIMSSTKDPYICICFLTSQALISIFYAWGYTAEAREPQGKVVELIIKPRQSSLAPPRLWIIFRIFSAPGP